MDKKDIIRMAREAGLIRAGEHYTEPARWGISEITDFYQRAVAAERQRIIAENAPEIERINAYIKTLTDEREKVAQWMMRLGYATGHGDTVEDLLQELDWQIREQERELIARSMDKQVDLACDYLDRKWAQEMAAAIRARGQA
jgi:hypothetical protein